MWHWRGLCWAWALALVLPGCASQSTLGTVFQALGQQVWGGADAAVPALDPALRYGRVQANGQAPAWLVLGYEDPHPLGGVQVWYSAQQEVLRLQQGRVVGSAGLPVNWRQVRPLAAPPAWGTLVPGQAVVWQRQRDVDPPPRHGVLDTVTTTFHGVGVPPAWARHLPTSVPAHAAAQWRWYSDTAQGLPTAWFAVAGQGAQAQVAYSHQCLAPQWCMHWQPWPVPLAGQEGARP